MHHMGSEEIGLVHHAQRLDTGINTHQPPLVFPDSFSCGVSPPPQRRSVTSVGHPAPATTRELPSFIDHHHNYFRHQPAEFRRSLFSEDHLRPSHQDTSRNWNPSGRVAATPSGEGSGNVDDDEDDSEVEGLVTVNNKNNKNDDENTSNNSNYNDTVFQKANHAPQFGLKERKMLVGQIMNEGSSSNTRNEVTEAETEGGMYYAQSSHGAEGSNGGQNDMVVENGDGYRGRKEGSYSIESVESLRAVLSDPLTGVLMDDAVILPCGHSFGSGGLQHVLRMRACYTCLRGVSEDSVSPNLSLRAAVQAFRTEEALHVGRASKRRRERYDQEKGSYGDSTPSDHARGRGVQFPFSLTDRVIIKGNKRTPQRFVGREAIVVNQCLNGWYVVKTVDNSEQVKLQYRSLAKIPDEQSAKPMLLKMTPNWLES